MCGEIDVIHKKIKTESLIKIFRQKIRKLQMETRKKYFKHFDIYEKGEPLNGIK
jgi:hypothetical protein